MSSSQAQINLPLLSLSLLQDIIQPITHDIVLSAVSREKQSRQPCPSCGATHNSRAVGKSNYVSRPGQDIYGRVKQKAGDSSSYFACTNCARKIAASRYAAHLERCLGGRGSRNRKYWFLTFDSLAATSSAAQSMASPMSSPPSPYVSDDDSFPKPSYKKRKLMNSSAKSHSQHAHGISTAPNSPSSLLAAGSTENDNYSDPGTTERSNEKRFADKTLPSMGSHLPKSQVSKFFDRTGSPVLSPANESGQDFLTIKNGAVNGLKTEISDD
ncbi:hypothetical protein V1512DRAFT_75232 [Lipomyces arxii]|uniref:uncharacterized protein n=1 Tax=Lipomyces arxii TaxID=56418 RepID=UPI0034CF2FC2